MPCSIECGGKCCAVFPYRNPKKRVESWANVPRPLTELAAFTEKEDSYILDMLIPLTEEQVEQRIKLFELVYDLKLDILGEGWKWYTCSHWDEESGLCKAYDERPRMCSHYPYGKTCVHCKCTEGSPLSNPK